MKEVFLLKDRRVIVITGSDAKSFLQSLISNDMQKASIQHLIYSMFLSPQGRFLSDLFILQTEMGYLIDLSSENFDEVFEKLKMYQLVSEVEIEDISDHCSVIAAETQCDKKFLTDPRSDKLGFRAFVKDISHYRILNEEMYHRKRVELLIPDARYDFFYNKTFPLEYGVEKLDAIDFKKGCYVGQEVTARTFYRGVIRKKLHKIKLNTSLSPEKGTEIKVLDKKMGIVLGSVGNLALGLINEEALQEVGENVKFTAGLDEVEIL